LADAGLRENQESLSSVALNIIAQNVDHACKAGEAICQDTGMPTFRVHAPADFDQNWFRKLIEANVVKATENGILRPNSVDPVSGKNSGNNLGAGTPVIHFHQHALREVIVELALKGGGSENMSSQYSLPCQVGPLGRADRDLEGVKKCALHAVHEAQGKGCAPGYLGVCIGGDRAGGYEQAKEQLFRSAFDESPDPQLAALERELVVQANQLGVGAMGLGGKVTLLGCKIGTLNRVPASFFVSIAYQCWAFRRLGVVLDGASGKIKRWLHRSEDEIRELARREGSQFSGREIILTPPISEEEIRSIKVGDVVIINGPVFTGRDAVHRYLLDHEPPVDLSGHVIYHCGPVMTKTDGIWQIRAAGPTTSIREEPYQSDVIKKCGLRAVIGKGGMGVKTLEGLKLYGAVYLTAVGGAAQIYAKQLAEVCGVHLLEEFGIPEALWHYNAQGFTTVCTMDAHGNSLHAEVLSHSAAKLADTAAKGRQLSVSGHLND
jgi:fumarate hydratase class I